MRMVYTSKKRLFQNRMLLPFVMMIYQYQHCHQKRKRNLEKDLHCICLQECTDRMKCMLTPFSLNKVPGNDRLHVTFYKYERKRGREGGKEGKKRRTKGRKEGRKEGGREGREAGRREGRKDCFQMSWFHSI